MSKRKTFLVEQFKKWCNEQLARVDGYALTTPGFKRTICTTLERVLMDTGNYEGYQNLYWMEEGWSKWLEAGEPDFPEKDVFIYGYPDSKYHGDEYARKYY